MEILKDEKTIKFEDIETEDIVIELREYLTEVGGEKLTIDLTHCEDLHTAVIQLIGAYKLIYDAEFKYKEEVSAYKMALESFAFCENDSN